MKDPDRLSSSHGASDFERELLDAGKKESMPSALREQMERALGLSGPAAGVTARARVEAATGVKASAMVWISAGVLVLGVVGGIVGARLGSRLFPPHATAPVPPEQPAVAESARTLSISSAPAVEALPMAPSAPAPARSTAPGPAPERRTVRLATPARSRSHAKSSRAEIARSLVAPRGHGSSAANAATPAAPTETATAPATAPTAESTPEAPARAVASRQRPPSTEPPARSRGAVVPPGDLRAEIDLIDAARAALRAGDMPLSLDLLGRHAVHFPNGALAPEETALRVEALMRLRRTSEARAYARRFVAANPASPLAERMRRLVNDARAP